MRILVVEDDARLADVVVRFLREESYAIDQAVDGQEAEWMAFENPYDLIILDLMLPRKSGIEVLQELRKGGIHVPILILTAKDKVNERIEGLDNGADDYLAKPFNLDELSARIRALLRRKQTFTPPILSLGPFTINASRKEILVNNQVIDLTAKEYSLLEYFIRNAGSVLSRTQISEHVWDVNFEPTSNVVDVYVGYLRSKIGKILGDIPIKTVRGHGYMLDLPSSEEFESLDYVS